MHVLVDPPPHVFDDELGLQIVSPPDDWRSRPDMDPGWTGPFRAGMVARARFVEDLVASCVADGVSQYVLLGAGLDTFALRRADLASRLHVYEIDQPGPQAWKQERLAALGYAPEWLRFVPVDFESGASWWGELAAAGFDNRQRTFVASIGVSMYLTKDATAATLRQVALLPAGSTLAMTFLLPTDLVDEADRPGYEAAQDGARRSGTPFVSFYTPTEMLALARDAGFTRVEHISSGELFRRYFAGRADGLRPSTGEDFLVATA
jgi:methyltransferase (TIGR00027 family)